jgi:hypothetical protein
MKFSEFIKEEDGGSLIGKTINGKLITKDTKNEHWEGDFNCYNNKQLTSLAGAPASVGGHFGCFNNKQLTSLAGAPASVGSDFNCANNKLTSLAGIHKIIKKMDGEFYASSNDIKSHVLGLLMIPGCKKVKLDNKEVEDILNKYLPNTGGNQWVMQCQTELIEAGYREYAKL